MSLEFGDIQSGVLRPRTNPYAATIILLLIDDRKAGRELMRRAVGVVNSCADLASKTGDAWVSLALTFQGLETLGVPQESLYSFPPGVPAGNGHPGCGAGRSRGKRSRKLGEAVWNTGHSCRAYGGRAGPGAVGGDSRAWSEGLCPIARHQGALAAGLLYFANGKTTLWLQ